MAPQVMGGFFYGFIIASLSTLIARGVGTAMRRPPRSTRTHHSRVIRASFAHHSVNPRVA